MPATEREILFSVYDDTSKSLKTTGGSSSGSAVAGNPLRVAAVYKATPVTRTDGQQSDLVTDAVENLLINMSSRLDPVNDAVTAWAGGNSYVVISTAATTTIKSGSGVVRQVRVLGGTLGNVTVYDNTAGSGTAIVPTVTPAGPTILAEDVGFVTGLTIVTAAATLILVTYR